MAANRPPDNHRAYFNNFLRDFPAFGIRLTRHARDRMEERKIGLPQIRTVLRNGSVQQVESDIKTGRDKYRVAGRDADGRNLEIVVNLDETGKGRVIVVTAIDSRSPGNSGRRGRGGHGGKEPPNG